MFDASAFSGCWAFRNSAVRNLEELCEHLSQKGLLGAAISPVEAILHPEPMTANRQFLQEVSAFDGSTFKVYPVPIIDPTLLGWKSHMLQCMDLANGHIPAFKLLPGYHGYDFNLPTLNEFADILIHHNIALCVQLRMEDARAGHITTKALAVNLAAIKDFAAHHRQLPILLCAPYLGEISVLADLPNVSAEMSFVESGHSLHDVLSVLDPTRVLVGTHAPLYMPAVGISKAFADDIGDSVRKLICAENFKELFSEVNARDDGVCAM